MRFAFMILNQTFKYHIIFFRSISLISGGPKLILELEPPFTFYQLYPGEKVPMVTCKTDCFQACYVSWHKVGVNSSSLNSQENVLNLGTFETQKAGVYICVVTQRETYNVGFRGVTFKMKGNTGMNMHTVFASCSY